MPVYQFLNVKKIITNQSRCFNCFAKGHSLSDCKSVRNCLTCNQRHNSLLHKPLRQESASSSNNSTESAPSAQSSSNSTPVVQINSNYQSFSSIILPTVIVCINDIHNNPIKIRALLDSGSQATLISESASKLLGFKREQARVPISCLSENNLLYSKGKVNLTIYSRYDSNNKFPVTAFILPKIIQSLPQSHIHLNSMDYLRKEYNLADPDFNVPSEINMILGTSVVFEVLKSVRYLHRADRLFIQDTHLGWIICSKDNTHPTQISSNHLQLTDGDSDNDQLLEKFWTLEEPPNAPSPYTSDEIQCENFYSSTTSRLPCGRFSVRLPFRSNKGTLGSSYFQAHRRLLTLERKFMHNPEFKNAYVKFMSEYESLGHMAKAPIDSSSLSFEHYVIPHHGIWQNSPGGA